MIFISQNEISLGATHRYFLYREATDMIKGFDGLSGLVRNELGKEPTFWRCLCVYQSVWQSYK